MNKLSSSLYLWKRVGCLSLLWNKNIRVKKDKTKRECTSAPPPVFKRPTSPPLEVIRTLLMKMKKRGDAINNETIPNSCSPKIKNDLQLTLLHLFLAYDLLTSNKSLLQKILVRSGNRQLMQLLQPILL
jgi:hypothetical protein